MTVKNYRVHKITALAIALVFALALSSCTDNANNLVESNSSPENALNTQVDWVFDETSEIVFEQFISEVNSDIKEYGVEDIENEGLRFKEFHDSFWTINKIEGSESSGDKSVLEEAESEIKKFKENSTDSDNQIAKAEGNKFVFLSTDKALESFAKQLIVFTEKEFPDISRSEMEMVMTVGLENMNYLQEKAERFANDAYLPDDVSLSMEELSINKIQVNDKSQSLYSVESDLLAECITSAQNAELDESVMATGSEIWHWHYGEAWYTIVEKKDGNNEKVETAFKVIAADTMEDGIAVSPYWGENDKFVVISSEKDVLEQLMVLVQAITVDANAMDEYRVSLTVNHYLQGIEEESSYEIPEN